ncbi:hypothetical protein [Streptomyces sp. NPDC006997]|uniref:hypothetical protein n=1 Tax=Streptomyces sp. NPDC006997 TaxID=3155356 RepID=UPI0033E52D5C
MAWDEWEQLKQGAAQRMQLNQLDPGGGMSPPPGGDLRVNQQDLAAVGDSAFDLRNDLITQDTDASASTATAGSGLSTQGFELGPALKHVGTRWDEQLQSLKDACGHISNHLEFTKRVHRENEYYVYGTISSIATLDEGFGGKADG